MSSDSSNNFHEVEPQKSFRIKQDNKFFSRLMSKETIGHSSSMVYYGSASGAIPFVWESHPGTPKHPSSSGIALPPLTPPPSYRRTSFKSKSKPKTKPMPRKSLRSTLFGSIFRKLNAPRKNHASPSSSSSSSSSSSFSSWSSSLHGSDSSSVSSFMNGQMFHRRKGYFSCSRSPVHNCMDDNEDEGFGSSTSRLCFGVKVKRRNMNEFGGCQSMVNMKKALLSFVSHD